MRQQLYAAATLAALLATPALAQVQTAPPAGQQTAPMPTPQDPGQPMPPGPAGDPAAAAPAADAPASPSATGTAGSTLPSGARFVEAQRENEILADDLIGTEVQNNSGETLGSISDLVLAEDGSLKAVVIGVGGFLGIGDRDVAVQWDSLNVTRDQGENLVLKLDAGREQLEQAPEFKTIADRRPEEEAARAQQAAPTTPTGAGMGTNAGGTMSPAPGAPTATPTR